MEGRTQINKVTRTPRYVNVLLGAWIIAAPWLLVGAALIALSFPRGARAIRRLGSLHRLKGRTKEQVRTAISPAALSERDQGKS